MATCDAETLIAEARCLCIPPGLELRVMILALCKLRQYLDPMATCDAETLIREAACLCIPNGLLPKVMASVLCQIRLLVEDGGLGGGGLTCGTTDPVDAPSGDCGWYYRRDTGRVWGWNSDLAIWEPYLT